MMCLIHLFFFCDAYILPETKPASLPLKIGLDLPQKEAKDRLDRPMNFQVAFAVSFREGILGGSSQLVSG